VGFGVLG